MLAGPNHPATIRRRADRAAVIEDMEWLVEVGTSPEEVCVRLGYKPATLGRSLHRWGRPDLAAYISTVARLDRLGRWAA